MLSSRLNAVTSAIFSFLMVASRANLYKELPSFQSLQIYIPASGTCTYVKNGSYTFSFEGSEQQVNGTTVTVQDSVLTVATKANTSVDYTDASYVIGVPSRVLSNITFSGAGSLDVEGETCSTEWIGVNAQGSTSTSFSDLEALGLEASASGASVITALGNLSNARLSVAGSGGILVDTVTEHALVQLYGSGAVAIVSEDSVQIDGVAYGSGKVYYSQGNCNIPSSWGSPGCQQGTFTAQEFKDMLGPDHGEGSFNSFGNSGWGNGYGSSGNSNGNYNSGNGNGNGNSGSGNGNFNSGSGNGNGNSGSGNGNFNSGSGNGNGNGGNNNGNYNMGNGMGNGFATNGNGNGGFSFFSIPFAFNG